MADRPDSQTADPLAQTLLRRAQTELPSIIHIDRPVRLSRAPGRLDVMGGIADYTGSLVCEATIDRAAGVLLQPRDDRQVHVFSFNLADEKRPATFEISIDALAEPNAVALRRDLADPGRRWAGYVVGCFFLLHEQGLLDLRDPRLRGVTLAVLSTVPLGAGVSSSAALEVATMMNLLDHYCPSLQKPADDPMQIATLCQAVENRIVGAPSGIMDQVTSLLGRAGELLCLICQPHELQPSLCLPPEIRVVGINSNVKHNVAGGQYGLTRCAAFMGHTIILESMRHLGSRAGRPLVADPMRGYLANLDPEDYKRLFRPSVPEKIRGDEFLSRYGPTIDIATAPQPQTEYFVRQATDHHVMEARRVRHFAQLIRDAAEHPHGTRDRGLLLDKAGHLMYASHNSYSTKALLGAPECDQLVAMVRKREPRGGLYGAKITGGGSGGTVAVLCDKGPKIDALLEEIMQEYQQLAGRHPDAFTGTSEGAWQTRTTLIDPRI